MANLINDAVGFMADPFGWGNSFSTSLGKSLGLDNNAAIDRAQGTLDDVLAKSNSVSAQNKGIYQNYLDQMKGMYGEGSAQYAGALENLRNAIGEGPDQFTATGEVKDFYDPYANQRQQQAMNAINASASTGGNRFSSSYNDKLAAKQQALASEEWQKAFDKWNADRARQLQEWQAGQSSKQNYISNLGTVTGLYGQDRTQLANALGDYYSNVANQNNADLEVYSDIAQTKSNLDAQRKSGIGSALGSIGSIVGAIF